MAAPEPKAFRDAMRAFVGNCSVITVGDGDRSSGLVVTSAISLSAEPPLLLACVNRSSSSHPCWPNSAGLAGPRSARPIRPWPSAFPALGRGGRGPV
ncbi:flavin reductase [Gemmobacter lanyuensis]